MPWLLIAATALFAAGPWLKPKPRPGAETAKPGTAAGLAIQFATAVYGGFFGAGMGVMMLATLGLTQAATTTGSTRSRTCCRSSSPPSPSSVFVSGGVVAWLQALVMVPGVALGGYAGVWAAKRVPQTAVRLFVVAVGLFLAVYYFVTG